MLLTALLLSSLAAALQPGTQEFEAAFRDYKAAIQAYGRCEEQNALDFLGKTSVGDLRLLAAQIPEANQQGPTGTPWGARLLASGFLVHERLAAESLESDPFDDHKSIAEAMLRRLREQSGVPDSLRDLAYALNVLESASPSVLARLPVKYRSQALFLLAIGSMHEFRSTPLAPDDYLVFEFGNSVPRELQPDTWGKALLKAARSGRRGNRDAAIARYRETIAADPSDSEAYLRLAFIFIQDERLTDAKMLIERARLLTKPAQLAYYEALVRGRLAEREGRPKDAEQEYADAAGIAPQAQTPVLARSHALLRQGRRTEAAEVFRTGIARASSDPRAEPWWQYPFGQPWRRPAYVKRLDELARRCAH